ncbi:MAG TPA: PTS sugar transporter subunit IIA [Rectinemataceae bacterium]|nr:PTS sugar transporter subunit IIA [Rectinemataceae bacterium]
MDLKSVLGRDSVALHLKGKTKEEIIDELLAVAGRSGKVTDLAGARKAVLERERRMSTGMKNGIAIPHGKTDTVKDLVACIGVSDTAVDFEALDRQPCRIFIMTLSPADKTGPHLQFLAEVSLLFRSDEKRAAILAAESPEAVLAVLTQ